MADFWKKLDKPFFALAPMEDVTDTSFRELVLSVSDSDVLKVVFTEFMSVDGYLDERGGERVAERIIVSDSERNILKQTKTALVAQIWGNDPEKFRQTAEQLSQLDIFAGIDINMGCPVKKVVKKGTCSALIKTPDLAAEIIQATKEGSKIPVSVKTRIGFNKVETEAWAEQLLKQNISALTLHGRTQKMQSDGLADWNEIAKAVAIRDSLKSNTAILGNGDVESYLQGMELMHKHKLNGVMVGRGVFKNPWIFNKDESVADVLDRFELINKHIGLFEKTWKDKKNYNILKRFFKIYINNFRGASAIRAALMETKNYTEAREILEEHFEAIQIQA